MSSQKPSPWLARAMASSSESQDSVWRAPLADVTCLCWDWGHSCYAAWWCTAVTGTAATLQRQQFWALVITLVYWALVVTIVYRVAIWALVAVTIVFWALPGSNIYWALVVTLVLYSSWALVVTIVFWALIEAKVYWALVVTTVYWALVVTKVYGALEVTTVYWAGHTVPYL